MASGKSFYGKRLSLSCKVPFYDLDKIIETKTSQSVEHIFDTKGEAYFRFLEKENLREFFNTQSGIISCGGGTPCFHNNMEWINANGISIYLDASLSTIIKNLMGDVEQRPLLKNKTEAELPEYLSQKIEERKIFYQQAKYRIPTHINVEEELINIYNAHA